jgi:hypothetical protein
MSSRVPVQEHYRWAKAPVPNPQYCVAQFYCFKFEAVEHGFLCELFWVFKDGSALPFTLTHQNFGQLISAFTQVIRSFMLHARFMGCLHYFDR